MIACVDAHYRAERTVAACVLIADWTDHRPSGSLVCNDNFSCRVFRGKSRRPLYITAVGIPAEEAAAKIRTRHGAYRIPAMLREADRLSREYGAGSRLYFSRPT